MLPVILLTDRENVAVWMPIRALWAAKNPRAASEALTQAAKALVRR
jgi:hypothetical protein